MKTNRLKNKVRPPSQADLGLAGGPGKGDAPRNCFSDDFKENFSEISGFGTATGFVQKRGRQVKKY